MNVNLTPMVWIWMLKSTPLVWILLNSHPHFLECIKFNNRPQTPALALIGLSFSVSIYVFWCFTSVVLNSIIKALMLSFSAQLNNANTEFVADIRRWFKRNTYTVFSMRAFAIPRPLQFVSTEIILISMTFKSRYCPSTLTLLSTRCSNRSIFLNFAFAHDRMYSGSSFDVGSILPITKRCNSNYVTDRSACANILFTHFVHSLARALFYSFQNYLSTSLRALYMFHNS